MSYKGMYSSPAYALGTDDDAKNELKGMRRSLIGWLKARKRTNKSLVGKPAASEAVAIERRNGEITLAKELYALLQQVYGDTGLPTPESPDAAVVLAQIAITEPPSSPESVGIFPAIGLIPALILGVGAVALFTITTAIKSSAETQRRTEELLCVRETGFPGSLFCTKWGWLKVAAIGGGIWYAWDYTKRRRT